MPTILIVEDEVDVADLYKLVLADEGYEIAGVFADPRLALAWIEEEGGGSPVDLVILDERLSGISGTAFLPSFKNAMPATRILVATADPDAAAQAQDLGADMAMIKPFSLDQLRSAVANLLQAE